MKTGASSLNPYAASYVPLSQRGAVAGNGNDYNKTIALSNGSEDVWCGHHLYYTPIIDQQRQNTSQTQRQLPNSEFNMRRGHYAGEYYTSPAHHPNGVVETSNNYEQEFMDLAYLQMNFPGVSEDSLSDVYLTNGCDLGASIDMLDQLEIYPVDPSERLPDTLDIGDVPDSSNKLLPQGQWNLASKAI